MCVCGGQRPTCAAARMQRVLLRLPPCVTLPSPVPICSVPSPPSCKAEKRVPVQPGAVAVWAGAEHSYGAKGLLPAVAQHGAMAGAHRHLAQQPTLRPPPPLPRPAVQGPERKAAILRVAMQQLLSCLDKCHSVGQWPVGAAALPAQPVRLWFEAAARCAWPCLSIHIPTLSPCFRPLPRCRHRSPRHQAAELHPVRGGAVREAD